MDKYNNKKTSEHWRGKVYITWNAARTAANICLDYGDDDFHVIAYVPAREVTEEGIRKQISSWGYDPDHWLEATP